LVVASRSAANSLRKDSRVLFGNLSGARARVNATPSASTVVLTSAAELNGTSLYAAGTPGQLMVLSAAAGTAHHGKTANITTISGSTLTVDVDFSAILAAGDIVAVLPPLSVELYLNGPHSLNSQLNNDYTKGITETFDTHNTPMTVDVGGDVPFFQIMNSEGFARLLLLGIGSYKTSVAGTHLYRPIEANDGTYTDFDRGTFWTQDGNGIVRQAYFGCFGTRLTLDYPESGTATGTISVLANGAVREVGGTGKTFTTGANNFVRANFVCDTGERLTFRSVFMELGGSFGAGLTTATETSVKNITLTIERGAIADRTLGDPNLVRPEEETFTLTVTGTRILNDDTYFEDAHGQTTDASPDNGAKIETRMLLKAVSPTDATKTLTFDIPRGVFSSHVIDRSGGRVTENFEYHALATLDATTKCPSTATPYVQATLVSASIDNLATAI
jgi:hypothetical protein